MRRTLFRILAGMEERQTTGLVRTTLAENELGRLIVSRGRLCLAYGQASMDPGIVEHSEDLRDLSALAQAARSRGESLCHAILTGPRERAFRAMLLAETTRGLVEIVDACHDAEPSMSTSVALDDYDVRLTFGAAEVFTEALRTRFPLAGGLAQEALDSVGDEGVALLLVRSSEPGEQPYPVAQRGFGEMSLRDLVSTARLAADLSQIPPRCREAGSITTFTQEGHIWRCVAGEKRLALLSTRTRHIDSATTYAVRFVTYGATTDDHA